MSTHQESGLGFTFPHNWRVIKFDEHRFYKYVNGIGLKGVDFIGIKPSGELFLIEVKNYADRFPQDGIKPYTALLEEPIPFGEKVAHKFDDSFQLIEVIYKYYLRKFWFRHLILKLIPLLPHALVLKYDWAFWPKAFLNLSQPKSKTTLIWWLELGSAVSKEERFDLHQQLHQYFQAYFKTTQQTVNLLDRHADQSEIQVKVEHT